MYVQFNKSISKTGKIYHSTLLCRKYRENGKIKTKVLANLSDIPKNDVISIKNALKKRNNPLVSLDNIVIKKTIDYGLVYVILHLMRQLGLIKILNKIASKSSGLIQSMILNQVVVEEGLNFIDWLGDNDFITSKIGVDSKGIGAIDVFMASKLLSDNTDVILAEWGKLHKTIEGNICLFDITDSLFGVEMSSFMGLLITTDKGFPLRIGVVKREDGKRKLDVVLDYLKKIKKTFNYKECIALSSKSAGEEYDTTDLALFKKHNVKFITKFGYEEMENAIIQKGLQFNLFSFREVGMSNKDVKHFLFTTFDKDNRSNFRKYLVATNLRKGVHIEEKIKKILLDFDKIKEDFLDMESSRDLWNGTAEQRSVAKGALIIHFLTYAVKMGLKRELDKVFRMINRKGEMKLNFNNLEKELKGVKLNILDVEGSDSKFKITALNDIQCLLLKSLNIDQQKFEEFRF